MIKSLSILVNVWVGLGVGVALFISVVSSACWTLDFGVGHMDKVGREALSSYKLLTVKTFKSQVVRLLPNKATVTALCHSEEGVSAIIRPKCESRVT